MFYFTGPSFYNISAFKAFQTLELISLRRLLETFIKTFKVCPLNFWRVLKTFKVCPFTVLALFAAVGHTVALAGQAKKRQPFSLEVLVQLVLR